MTVQRCDWVTDDPIYIAYHDEEWGVPKTDPQQLFEFLMLEGMQAGLSWLVVLKKRQAMKEAFAHFDPTVLAQYDPNNIDEWTQNTAIIRNKAKLKALITNAQAWLELQNKQGDIAQYLWSFTNGQTIHNNWPSYDQVPGSTPESDAMAKALKQAGFKFVGTKICYAFMQAIGMVNDHTTNCFRHREI